MDFWLATSRITGSQSTGDSTGDSSSTARTATLWSAASTAARTAALRWPVSSTAGTAALCCQQADVSAASDAATQWFRVIPGQLFAEARRSRLRVSYLGYAMSGKVAEIR